MMENIRRYVFIYFCILLIIVIRLKISCAAGTTDGNYREHTTLYPSSHEGDHLALNGTVLFIPQSFSLNDALNNISSTPRIRVAAGLDKVSLVSRTTSLLLGKIYGGQLVDATSLRHVSIESDFEQIRQIRRSFFP